MDAERTFAGHWYFGGWNQQWTIENIHQHFDMGKPKALAIWDGL